MDIKKQTQNEIFDLLADEVIRVAGDHLDDLVANWKYLDLSDEAIEYLTAEYERNPKDFHNVYYEVVHKLMQSVRNTLWGD